MAAITTVITAKQATKRIRTAAAVGAGTTVDWVAVPRWARFCRVYFNLTAISAGSAQIVPKDVVPISLDDSNVMTLSGITAPTAQTAASMKILDIGPYATPTATATDAVQSADSATVNTTLVISASLPAVLGLSQVIVTGNSTYTLDVLFRW